MASTFEELVEMQRAANEAQAKASALRELYGPPTVSPWTRQQNDMYETAIRAWRDLERDVQSEMTEYAKEQGRVRGEVEEEVNARAGKPTQGA
ncbi:hypothetical protein ABZ845_09395 [Streptomyces sp. NPDC047022]|uniref:hypothetical protein n=1 Tax=Streptomyces sp. NPDC047022 TaxID=3155737 RepID=UPI0033F7169E